MTSLLRAAAAAFLFSLAAATAAFADTAIDRAGELFDKQDFKGAVALLDPYLKAHPRDAKALVIRGDAQDSLGRHEAALADYNSAIAINPQFQYAYATRCSTENELDHFQDAVADCSKAHDLDPSDDYALRQRSFAYFWLDDYKLAADDAASAIKIDPKNANNLLAQCRANTWLNRTDIAIPACQSYVTYRPDDADGYFYRGRAEMIQGDTVSARRDFVKALQLDDALSGATYWTALLDINEKKWDACIADSTSFLAANPDTAAILVARATAYHEVGKNDLAKTDALRALHDYQVANDQDGIDTVQILLKLLGTK